ncbi:MAG: hypothetical protein UT26_C0058G0003 [Microgenomates group bacterium GW2011_GWC1_39_12]|nr:MAG: hypothetical protein UT26_C0058G0003 [Microgenomates group bacterium GW2011_GWC1_39_12]
MLVGLVASPEIAQRLRTMSPSDVTMILARIAASKAVGILKVSALKEAEEAIKAGKRQDVVVLENMEVMDDWSYPGPWSALRINVHGSSRNHQLNMKSDKKMKPAVGLLAEMFRQQVLPDVASELVAGYIYRDYGGFSQASLAKLVARLAKLAKQWWFLK